jgi:hypothetical protein
MIRYAHNLDRAGAAVYLALACPSAVDFIRVERRYADPADHAEAEQPGGAGATLIYAGPPTDGVLDWHEVLVGVPHWYVLYGRDVGGTWGRLGAAVDLTPTAHGQTPRLDAMDVLRERLEVGFNALLASGILAYPDARIRVLLGPPAIDHVAFPAVAVNLEQAAPDQQYIGGALLESHTESGDWEAQAGWYARYHVQVGIWALNPDERRLWRAALRDTLIANREVLEWLGIQEMETSLSDHEDFNTYAAPLYCTTASLRFLAPCTITLTVDALRDVVTAVVVTPESARAVS